MKVYAIKRADGKYLKVTITPYNDFNEDEFVNDLYEATLYASYDLEYAEYKCEDLRDCKIVECELMEANELADYDKKVRAEVVAENQALKERWEKLKEFAEKEWNLCEKTSLVLARILDKMQELEE